MTLKDIWKDKVDNVDDVVAEDINAIAQAVIALEDAIEEIENNGGGGDINNAVLDAIIAEQESIIAIQNALIGGDAE